MFDVWELWLVLEGPGIREDLQVSYCRDVTVYEKDYDGPLNSDYGTGYKTVRIDKLWCGPFTYNTQFDCIYGGRVIALDRAYLQNRWGQRPDGGENWETTHYDVYRIQCRKAQSETRGRTESEIANWKPDWEIDWDARERRDERGRDMSFWKEQAEYDRTRPERIYEDRPEIDIDDQSPAVPAAKLTLEYENYTVEPTCFRAGRKEPCSPATREASK